MKDIEEILRYFPNKIYQMFFNLFNENTKMIGEIQEIRMRADRPILLKLIDRDFVLHITIRNITYIRKNM